MAFSGHDRPQRHQPPTGNFPPTNYYFAYGSNLCLGQMKKRCPKSKFIGVARLSNHRWHINERGYANIKTAQGHWVEGLVYEIDEEDEASLDLYEGVAKDAYHKCLTRVSLQKAPAALYRRPVSWIVNQGGPAEVCRQMEGGESAAARQDRQVTTAAANTLTYINLVLTGDSHPKQEYIRRMNLGISDAIALGISEEYVRRYMRPFIPKTTPLNPRESEPATLKKTSESPARGRNAAAAATRSREFASKEKHRALSLPPERKKDGTRPFSRGRSKLSSSEIKDPVRSDGPPPLPPRPHSMIPDQALGTVEQEPRQSGWKWWPFSK